MQHLVPLYFLLHFLIHLYVMFEAPASSAFYLPLPLPLLFGGLLYFHLVATFGALLLTH